MKKFTFMLMLFFLIFIAGCKSTQSQFSSPEIILVTVVVTDSNLSTSPTEMPIPTPTVNFAEKTDVVLTPEDTETVIASEEAKNYLGQEVTIKIETADCSYHPEISGEPTFCNDQPYPDHNFTLVVWGEDWTFLDEACILVSGVIEEYDNRPQIEAESLDQIDDCP